MVFYHNKIRMDGRKYRGYWHNGKRHGDGEFYKPKRGIWKKGVWVDDIQLRQHGESTTTSNMSFVGS